MKTIAIMQPYLFPYLGYFQLISLCDKFIILDDVNFIKKGWINRNRILGQVYQEPSLFTVPLKDASQNHHICDTLIHENYLVWKKKFMATLAQNYKKTAPHYGATYNIIDEVLNSCEPGSAVSTLATNSLKTVCKYLKINTEFGDSSSIYNNQRLKGQDRILDICIQEKANQYINLIGGQELYSKETFTAAGVDLKFHQIDKYKYSQGLDSIGVEREFHPHLSIIDILMFCDKIQIKDLLSKYKLI